MFSYKISMFLVSVLLSSLVVVTGSSAAFAANSGLVLDKSVVNASVFDNSKNRLVIKKAKGLSKRVLIKTPDKKVQIEGTLVKGDLQLDLTKLGRANLLPQGKYQVIAKRGKKKLTTSFELNPPTLYAKKIEVPLNSNKPKERAIRFQSEGSVCYSDPCPPDPSNPDAPVCLAPVIDVACNDPSCNMGPCYKEGEEKTDDYCIGSVHDPENLEEIGHEMEYPVTIEDGKAYAEIWLETTGDYKKSDCVISADIVVDGNKEAEVSSVEFVENANLEDNVVEGELNNSTTTATDIYLAGITEANTLTSSTEGVADINLEDLYNKTVQECAPLKDLPQGDETAKAIIANISNEIAMEFKDAFLKAIETLEGSELANELMKLGTEAAAKFASEAPNFAWAPDEELIKPESFFGYHEIAGGLLNPQELGIPEDANFWVDMYEKKGIVAGSLKPTSIEEAIKAFKSGSAPVYEVNADSLAQNFNLIKDAATIFGTVINPNIVIPPGSVFDASKAALAFEEHKISEAAFTFASTTIIQGQYDPSAFSGKFTFNAEPGVIAHESFTNIFNNIEMKDHDFSPGTVFAGEGSIGSVLPPSITEYINKFGNPIPTGWIPTGDLSGHPAPSGDTHSPVPTGWTPTDTTNLTGTTPISAPVIQPIEQPTSYTPPPPPVTHTYSH